MGRFIIFLFFSLISFAAVCQTCCSGGVPTSSNIGLPQSEKGTLQFSLSYDLNALNTLKSGSETEINDSRNRLTHTAMLQTGWSATPRWSFDVFLPWVRQERRILFQGQVSDFTSTSSIGDLVFLTKNNFLKKTNGHSLTGAVGLKMPTGASNLRNDFNLPLNADLQPGSGAWDGMFLLEYTRPIFRPSMNFFARTIFTEKGTNNNYLGGSAYRFGREFQIQSGLSDKFFIRKTVFDAALSFRFRNAAADSFNEGIQPGTGGRWVFINPSITWWQRANFSLTANLDLPVFAYVKNTQVTPTYRLNIGIFHKINLQKETILSPLNF